MYCTLAIGTAAEGSSTAVQLQVCFQFQKVVFSVSVALFCFCNTNLGGGREVINSSASNVMNNSFTIFVISIQVLCGFFDGLKV